jgi:hypothetical protein
LEDFFTFFIIFSSTVLKILRKNSSPISIYFASITCPIKQHSPKIIADENFASVIAQALNNMISYTQNPFEVNLTNAGVKIQHDYRWDICDICTEHTVASYESSDFT